MYARVIFAYFLNDCGFYFLALGENGSSEKKAWREQHTCKEKANANHVPVRITREQALLLLHSPINVRAPTCMVFLSSLEDQE